MSKLIHTPVKDIWANLASLFSRKDFSGEIIFRDDDINFLTDLDQFKRVDSLFKFYGVPHTIAIIAKDIEKSPDLVAYIKANSHIKVELHAWQHVDFTKIGERELEEHFNLAVKKIEEIFGKKPTTWYPPWNKTNSFVNAIAEKCGLIASWKQTSLMYFVKQNSLVYTLKNKLQNTGRLDFNVINFHYWADSDLMFLDPALEYYAHSSLHR